MLAKVVGQALQDLLGLKGKRDKKDRGCLEWSTSAGGAQTAVEMLRLCTQVTKLLVSLLLTRTSMGLLKKWTTQGFFLACSGDQIEGSEGNWGGAW